MVFDMVVKFYLISIYAVFSSDFIVRATHIPTSRCMQRGWDLCNIRQIDINPAERLLEDDSCYVDRGSNITVSFNFTPRFEAHNLKWSIWVETVIGDYRMEGVPDDARNLSNHPTIENKINPFLAVVHIPADIRAKLWVVRVTLTGDSDRDVCCFLCEIRVRQPQTTTVTTFDPTNPYDILRRQVSFPSIWDFNEVMKNFQNNTGVFDKFILDNAPTISKPSYLTILKNFFKRLLGLKSGTPAKVPFLGNASSLMEYFSMAHLAKTNKNDVERQTTRTDDETSVNIDPSERCSDEVNEEITFTIAAASSIGKLEPEVSETVTESKADTDKEVGDDEMCNEENDLEIEETTTTTVKTIRKIKLVRSSQRSRRKLIKSGSGPMKAARAGIKRTVRPISKSTTTS